MKVEMIIIAFFSGWLINEIKEVLVNGGFDNKLAFTLLKIVFICICILIFGTFEIPFRNLFRNAIDETHNKNFNLPKKDESKNNIETFHRTRSLSKRSNKFLKNSTCFYSE